MDCVIVNPQADVCTICKKKKDLMPLKYTNSYVYVLCECEVEKNRKTEEENRAYAIKTARKLRSRSSHIAPINRCADFDTMVVDKYNEKAVRACKYVSEKLLENKEHECKLNVILQGNRGSGKTFIASALINAYNNTAPISEQKIKDIITGRKNGYKAGEYTSVSSDCKFITECDLYAVFYDNFNYSRRESPLDEYKMAKKLLVIDDVGTCGGDYNKVQAVYNNIIDYRYSNMLPTLITTNLKRTELNKYIGERAVDRLQSNGYFIDLTTPQSRR